MAKKGVTKKGVATFSEEVMRVEPRGFLGLLTLDPAQQEPILVKSFEGKKKRKQVKVILRTVPESFMSSGYAHDERREEKENVRNGKSKSSLLIWS